ncbi:hypothetical protein PIB30_008519 [Stylosanthes scabra]|uniref:Uncharacterized protein n=1 Tax=Stylosanthes scabra TaxID=79078 RepID=A0ABU6Z2Q7_9FABA|nr:hypothetical protein [Stylosanthes scabra]
MGIIPHFLVIPFPVLGHINPITQFSNVLIKHGCKVTFLHTEFSHKRAQISAKDGGSKDHNNINYVTLPDGLDHEDDRSDLVKVLLSMIKTMPSLLPKLIEDINALDSSATTMASVHSLPKLMEDGIIDSDGNTTKKQKIQFSPLMPMMDPTHFAWGSIGKVFFDHLYQQEIQLLNLAEWWLCNTAYDLEPGALSVSPRFLPIGPLMEIDNNNNKSSSFWKEDTTCLEWLDQQQPQSVVYVSFGSLAVMESNQFKELALALDLIDNPFLWVVRPDNKDNYKYPDEFHGRKGKIVVWVSQKKVLNHPAIACFISHCGWNSTIEGVYSGVPFLCWPFFSDQFWDESYICDVWKVGLGLNKDENGFISKEEIRKKVEKLFGDEGIRERSLKLKQVTRNNLAEGGKSKKNLENFVNWAK